MGFWLPITKYLLTEGMADCLEAWNGIVDHPLFVKIKWISFIRWEKWRPQKPVNSTMHIGWIPKGLGERGERRKGWICGAKFRVDVLCQPILNEVYNNVLTKNDYYTH